MDSAVVDERNPILLQAPILWPSGSIRRRGCSNCQPPGTAWPWDTGHYQSAQASSSCPLPAAGEMSLSGVHAFFHENNDRMRCELSAPRRVSQAPCKRADARTSTPNRDPGPDPNPNSDTDSGHGPGIKSSTGKSRTFTEPSWRTSRPSHSRPCICVLFLLLSHTQCSPVNKRYSSSQCVNRRGSSMFTRS